MRRSIFGFFCRRCFVSFIKLSYAGVVKLQNDYQFWCTGNSEAGYGPIRKDQLNGGMFYYWLLFLFYGDHDVQTCWYLKRKQTRSHGRSPTLMKCVQPWLTFFLCGNLTQKSFRWEKGLATGDERIATENLRRFFEQHFHESNDS
jgi:hypothetical protein